MKCVAQPVTAGIEAHDAIFPFQGRGLLVPHVQIAGERMAHDDPGAAAFDFVVDPDAVSVDLHRGLL